jgi:hypothetical protein
MEYLRNEFRNVLNGALLPSESASVAQISFDATYRVKGNYSATMERIAQFDLVVHVRALRFLAEPPRNDA